MHAVAGADAVQALQAVPASLLASLCTSVLACIDAVKTADADVDACLGVRILLKYRGRLPTKVPGKLIRGYYLNDKNRLSKSGCKNYRTEIWHKVSISIAFKFDMIVSFYNAGLHLKFHMCISGYVV